MKEAAKLDKHKIKSSFAAASASYDDLAGFQRRIGWALLEKYPVSFPQGRVLDLGCGTGFLSRELSKAYHVGQLLALDIAMPMLEACRLNLPQLPLNYVCADAENLPLQDGSFRAIYSNLALQWCQDLLSVFVGCRRILENGGELVFSTFGPNTLHELKASWAEVDKFVHVNEFYSSEAVCGFLQQAGFHSVYSESIIFQSNYTSVMALMYELKGIGAHNSNLHRNRKTTSRGQLQQMITSYENRMIGNEVVASYEIIFIRAVR